LLLFPSLNHAKSGFNPLNAAVTPRKAAQRFLNVVPFYLGCFFNSLLIANNPTKPAPRRHFDH
ncbi:MAG: hypothetical protein KC475_08490, partial [Cyanobacteria bacterium HKST-UBA03]|nr:hypothetical protein [Cyanobacteria bacterium HKST-UBA03]